jgi:hypothetical protein
MRIKLALLALALVTVGAAPAWAVDLTRIDRTIAKEPAYGAKPKYCLLVFGPEAKTQVWLVLDGDVLYVDRNGNGDLTEEGERLIAVQDQGQFSQEGWRIWQVGDLHTSGGKVSYTKFMVCDTTKAGGPDPPVPGFAVTGNVPFGKTRVRQTAGSLIHYRGNPLQFAGRPEDAPILHFDGPLAVIVTRSPQHLVHGAPNDDFEACVGTAGGGKDSAAVIDFDHGGFPDPDKSAWADIDFTDRQGHKQHFHQSFVSD